MGIMQTRKIFRDIWQNKSRTILVILSIAVGVFAFGVIIGARSTLLREVNASYLSTNPASFVIYTNPFDDDLVEVVSNMPEVAVAEGRRQVTVRQQISPNDWQDLTLYAIPDFEDIPLSRIEPESGAWPPPKRTVLIERQSLPDMNAAVGESILVETPDGDQRQMVITGLTHDQTLPPSVISGLGYGYITFDTLAWLGQPTTYNHLHVLVAENEFDKAHIEQVAELVIDKVERSGRTVTFTDIPEPGKHPAEEIMPTILLILTMLGLLSLLLSGFLVINTISAILAQQRKQIGIMKSIGGKTVHIVRMYLIAVALFGLMAVILAIPLGALGATGLSRFIANMLNIDLVRIEITPQVLVVELLIGLLVPVLAALYPILSTARLTVREALDNNSLGTGQFGTSLIDRLLVGIRRVLALPRPVMLSLRNTFRQKGRLILTLVTLILGGAIFISVLTVRTSLFRTLYDAIQQNNYDILINFKHPYRLSRLEHELTAFPGIAHLEGWNQASGSRLRADGSDSDTFLVVAPPADTQLLSLDLIAGRWIAEADSNAIVVDERFLKEEGDLALGDSMTLTIDNEETTWQIVGVTQAFQPPLTPYSFYINQAAFARNIGDVGEVSTIRLILEPEQQTNTQVLARQLDAYFQSRGIQLNTIKTISDDRANIVERFNILTTLLMVMSLLMALVGGLGLMGTMSINVLERIREIGIIRAIGASDGAVIQIFVIEGVFIGLLSWLAGGMLSLVLSRLMSRQIGMVLFQMPLSYVYAVNGLLIWLVLVLVIATVASFLPAWNASRLTVRDVLAYE